MKQRFIELYMDWAKRLSEMSYAKRLKVGAVIVKDDTVISYGYNGMPAGWDNNCEDESVELYPGFEGAIHRTVLKTKSEVLHAETNAIAKLARSPNSGADAAIFITHSPCLECAKLIFQSGINSVYYLKDYRSQDGVQFLKDSGITVEKLESHN